MPRMHLLALVLLLLAGGAYAAQYTVGASDNEYGSTAAGDMQETYSGDACHPATIQGTRSVQTTLKSGQVVHAVWYDTEDCTGTVAFEEESLGVECENLVAKSGVRDPIYARAEESSPSVGVIVLYSVLAIVVLGSLGGGVYWYVFARK